MEKSEIKSKRYEYIDALRGVAILAVLFNHVHESTEPVFSIRIRIPGHQYRSAFYHWTVQHTPGGWLSAGKFPNA